MDAIDQKLNGIARLIALLQTTADLAERRGLDNRQTCALLREQAIFAAGEREISGDVLRGLRDAAEAPDIDVIKTLREHAEQLHKRAAELGGWS